MPRPPARPMTVLVLSTLMLGVGLTGCVGSPERDRSTDAPPTDAGLATPEVLAEPTPAAELSAYRPGPDNRIAAAPGYDPSQTLLYFVQFFFAQSQRERGLWRQVVSLDASLQIDAEDGPALYLPVGPLAGDETIGVVLIHEGKGAAVGDTETDARRTADVLLRRRDGSTVVVRVEATIGYGPDWFTDSAHMYVLPEWTEGPGWRLEWIGGDIVQSES